MHYDKVLSGFKVEYESYKDLKREDAPKAPFIQDKDRDKRVIKWDPIFKDAFSRIHGSRGPVIYILWSKQDVPSEEEYPLQTDYYLGASGCLYKELVARIPHPGPIYKHDNSSVFMMVEVASRGTSVESTVKASLELRTDVDRTWRPL